MVHGSSKSDPTIDRPRRRDLLILVVAAITGSAIFLAASALEYRVGFPLDDSWIHQTYARNLAEHGQWAFRIGQPSAGSTAPLWSAFLAIGYWLGLAPYAWTYFLGAAALWGLAAVVEAAVRRAWPDYRPPLPWAGLFVIVEWRMLWAAMSGMETLLHALLLTLVLAALIGGTRRYLTVGLLTGLSVWVRPDGLTLMGPVLLAAVLVEPDWRARMRAASQFLLGLGALFFFYILFNLVIGGTPMPNTFYAKQAEYVAWQGRPILDRSGQAVLQLLVGPFLLLLPGVTVTAWDAIRSRAWGMLAALLWCAGYLALYVARLPVYQHGRYLMPAMPLLFLLGLLGYLRLAPRLRSDRLLARLGVAWSAALVLLALGFLVLGAKSYAEDVALIESEMVVTARWVEQHLPADALIAAHDIGALGYFDGHDLLDLAGLISPEVVPFVRDEPRLADYLDRRGADFLIAFPEFYPRLLQTAEPVFSTGGIYAPKFGGRNMAVYRWKRP